MGLEDANEAEILAALDRADHAEAATRILRAFGPQILGYLTATLRSEDAAREAYGDFSEDLWTGLPGFKRQSSVRGWAYKVAWHAALKIAQDPYKKRGRPLATREYSEVAEEVRSSTAMHLRTATKDRLSALRDELTPEEQSLLILRIDKKLPWREIAEAMGAEEPTLRKRLERVKERLSALARERGLLEPG